MGKTIWIGILGMVAVLALFFFFSQAPDVTEVIEEPEEPAAITAQPGDLLSINYVLRLDDGTVVDTNNATLAEEAGLDTYVKGDFTFILGQSGKVYGFDQALIGMEEGEHREAIIEPSEEEIILHVNYTQTQNRFAQLPRHQSFPPARFEDFFKKPAVVGDIVYNNKFAWKFKVINVTDERVMTEMYVKPGEELTLPGLQWKSRVAAINNNSVMFYHKPEENQSVDTDFGPARIELTGSRLILHYEPEIGFTFEKTVPVSGSFSSAQEFQIVELADDYFVVKRIGLLADKRLGLSADLISLTKDVKKVDQSTPHRLTGTLQTAEN